MHFVNNHPVWPAGKRAFDEIVFRGRNKAYGAYVLRAEYERTLFKALFLMILGVATFTGLGWLLSRTPAEIPADIIQIIPQLLETPVNLEPEPKPKSEPAPQRKDPAPQSNNAAPIYTVSSDEPVKKDTALFFSSEPSSSQTTAGNSGTDSTAGSDGAVTGKGTENTGPLEIYDVGTMPEFEGGMNALKRFIAENVIYPRQEAEQGNSGLVMVRFVVDEKGRISDVTIKRSASHDFDKEATRVVRLLPGFKTPGKIGDRAVKVYYELPIHFKIR
jgi:protein TonB